MADKKTISTFVCLLLSFVILFHSIIETSKSTALSKKFQEVNKDCSWQTMAFKQALARGIRLETINTDDLARDSFQITIININPKYWLGVYDAEKLFLINVTEFYKKILKMNSSDLLNGFRRYGLMCCKMSVEPITIKRSKGFGCLINDEEFPDKEHQYFRIFYALLGFKFDEPKNTEQK